MRDDYGRTLPPWRRRERPPVRVGWWSASFSRGGVTTIRKVGVFLLLHCNGRGHAVPTARELILPLRGTPGRLRLACRMSHGTHTITVTTNSTILIHTEVRGFLTTLTRATENTRAMALTQCTRPPSVTHTMLCKRTQQKRRAPPWQTAHRGLPREGLVDQLDRQKPRPVHAHGSRAGGQRSR